MKPPQIAGVVILTITIGIALYALFSETTQRTELLVIAVIGLLWGTSNLLGLPGKMLGK